MITSAQFQQLKQGGFASIQLKDGPLLSGFAAQDLEISKFLRLDGMIENEDGLLAQFALRLEESEIEAPESLSTAPIFTSSSGESYTMNAAFWTDMD